METTITRRAELLDQIVASLLVDGVAELSLRPLADRVGTSARLLIYHFGSKEELVAAALGEVRRRIGASLHARAEDVRPRSLRALLSMVWAWATEPSHQPYFRLLFEVDGMAMFNRLSFSEEVKRANSAVWITLIDKAAGRMSREGDLFSAHSTLILSTFSGLLQEFLTTGDLERTTAALNALTDLVSRSAASTSASQGSGL